MSNWDKFINSKSIECLNLFKNEYEKTGDLSTLRNHNLVLMDIGEWQKAKSNYIKIIEKEEYSGEGDFINIGITDWFFGNTTSAIEFWQKSLETEYVNDPVGPINGYLVLWYAGQRLGDDKLIKESLKKLKKFWKVQDYRIFKEWPGTTAIAGFLFDEVPINIFLHEWKRINMDITEFRRLCRVNFWIGMKCLEDNDEPTAIAYFKSSFSGPKNAILEYEYFLAKWEYSRLTGENLWPQKR